MNTDRALDAFEISYVRCISLARRIKSCLDSHPRPEITGQPLNDLKQIVLLSTDDDDREWVQKAIDSIDDNAKSAGLPFGGEHHLYDLESLYQLIVLCRNLQPLYQYAPDFKLIIDDCIIRRLTRKNKPVPILFTHISMVLLKRFPRIQRIHVQNFEFLLDFSYGLILEQSKTFLRRGWFQYRVSDEWQWIIRNEMSSHERIQMIHELPALLPLNRPAFPGGAHRVEDLKALAEACGLQDDEKTLAVIGRAIATKRRHESGLETTKVPDVKLAAEIRDRFCRGTPGGPMPALEWLRRWFELPDHPLTGEVLASARAALNAIETETDASYWTQDEHHPINPAIRRIARAVLNHRPLRCYGYESYEDMLDAKTTELLKHLHASDAHVV